MKRKGKLTIAIATVVLALLGGAAVYGQDKYSLKSPSGIAFSDFEGYEDWAESLPLIYIDNISEFPIN
ncbi:MAG: hypothetical protein WA730_17965 [Pseudolabrys sp.]